MKKIFYHFNNTCIEISKFDKIECHHSPSMVSPYIDFFILANGEYQRKCRFSYTTTEVCEKQYLTILYKLEA